GVPLCTAAGDQTLPVIAPDGFGGAILAWEDFRDNRPRIYTQRVNSAGVTRWAANGLSLSALSGDGQSPAIVSTPSGRAMLVWEDSRRSTFNADLYGQCLDSAGVAQWPANGLAISSAGSDQANA